jgi:hypothetical protein
MGRSNRGFAAAGRQIRGRPTGQDPRGNACKCHNRRSFCLILHGVRPGRPIANRIAPRRTDSGHARAPAWRKDLFLGTVPPPVGSNGRRKLPGELRNGLMRRAYVPGTRDAQSADNAGQNNAEILDDPFSHDCFLPPLLLICPAVADGHSRMGPGVIVQDAKVITRKGHRDGMPLEPARISAESARFRMPAEARAEARAEPRTGRCPGQHTP